MISHHENSDILEHVEMSPEKKEEIKKTIEELRVNLDLLEKEILDRGVLAQQEKEDRFRANEENRKTQIAHKAAVKKHAEYKKALKKDGEYHSLLQMGSKTTGSSNDLTPYSLTKTCLKAIFSSVNNSFCYKSNGDAGDIPTKCACGYFRFWALCYKTCDSGYTFLLGVCWEKCGSGYTDLGVLCYSGTLGLKGRSSYIPNSKTNFDDVSICNWNQYKFGALCYRDCTLLGMANCGIGACSASSSLCTATIVEMGVSILLGATKFMMFVMAPGSSTASTAGSAAAGRSIIETMKAKAYNLIQPFVSSFTNSTVRQALFNKVKKFIASQSIKMLKRAAVQQICRTVTEGFLEQIKAKSDADATPTINDYDPTGIADIATNCTAGMDATGKLNCTSAILGMVNKYDPTGLLLIATALIYPTCDGI